MSWRTMLRRLYRGESADGSVPSLDDADVPGAKAAYVGTFVAEAFSIVGYLAAFRIIAIRLGTQGFGEYALSRRTLSLVAPVAIIGLDLAIVRYVSQAVAQRTVVASTYLTSALILMGSATLIVSVVLLGLAPVWAVLFFGGAQYVHLVKVMPLVLAGLGLHAVVYGYLRGRLWIGAANILGVANFGAVPVLAALFGGATVDGVFGLMGGLWLLISGGALSVIPMTFGGTSRRVSELARYGVVRMPGDFSRLVLLGLPGILVAHISDVKEGGVVAFGVATLGLAGTSLAPISLVLLPFATRHLSTGSRLALRAHVLKVAGLAIGSLILAILSFEAFAPLIIRWYLGPDFENSSATLRLMILGALPWGIYIIFRSVIDAHHTSAVNGRNMGIALACFLCVTGITWLVAPSTLGIVVGLVAGLWLLGILTALETIRVLRGVDPPDPSFPPASSGHYLD